MSGIDIKWGDFALVFGVALVATVVIATSYASGLRLLAVARSDGRSQPVPMAGAVLCFAIGVAAVLYGLYLIIPQLHGK